MICVKIDECHSKSACENVIFCNRISNYILNTNNGLNSISELVGGSSINNKCKMIEISSIYLSKIGALPAKKLKNCNLLNDGNTLPFAKKIIVNSLKNNIFYDDTIIFPKNTIFSFEVDEINYDLNTVVIHSGVEKSVIERSSLATFCNTMPDKIARVPPYRIIVLKGRGQKYKNLENLEKHM